MSRLHDATARLESALGRLEAAVADRSTLPAGSEGELQSTLDQARQENAALRQSLENATTRLDGAIERLKSVLGPEDG